MNDITHRLGLDSRAWVPECLDPTQGYLKHMEDVSFTYRKISWTWVLDGIESEDSWVTPK